MNSVDERFWYLIAMALTLGGTLWAYVPPLRGNSLSRRGIQLHLFLATIALSLFLYYRGEVIQRCPLTNSFEATAFMTWGLLITYFVVGTSYRLSILGAITSPLALGLLSLAWVFAKDAPMISNSPILWKSEFHAAMSVLSYGTLGLAAISAGIYLIQESHLKKRTLTAWFYRFPSMGDLDVVHHRLLRWGFLLLTIGVFSGYATNLFENVSFLKVAWAWAIWTWYLGLLFIPRWVNLSHRRFAWASLLGYVLTLLSFVVMNQLLDKLS